MSLSDLLGYAAALLTTSAFVPQVVQTPRTRDTRAISLGMYLLFSAGVALWWIYGILLAAWPIILANGITLLLALVVLGYKLTESQRL
ncbi:SemiSWEET transporter [Thiocystis violacea]|uniref:SemiSWEET transporter n=1 Tax=Thiocystis violacea TaxID=13725 RepID=UPI001907BF02|nr:SemiSWEET transporter [Thiocystis violacea]MBK1721967.1 hypothetical protein [Thiocystis violacea]